ncbi:unnamed protein product [Caenorhabditis nigoni]
MIILMSRPRVFFTDFLLWLLLVLGVFTIVACLGFVYTAFIDPIIRRRRQARAAQVAAHFQRDTDTTTLIRAGGSFTSI